MGVFTYLPEKTLFFCEAACNHCGFIGKMCIRDREDAKKNDIIPFNPAHRVRKRHFEKEVQHIPQKYEMGKLMRAIQNEPILYRAYYTLSLIHI